MRSMHVLAAAALVLASGCSSDDSGGEKMTVVYEATGSGRASLIRYVDVGTERVVHLADGAPLPWKVEATGEKKKDQHITLSVSAADDKDEVTCRLTVDGKEVAKETSPTIVECKLPTAQ